jgi:protein SCO1/2
MIKNKFLIMVLVLLGGSFVWASPQQGSLHTPSFHWKGEASQEVQLKYFKGKWLILSMMYTTCQGSCPLIMKKMRKIEAALKEKKKQAHFVLITFDPKRDTPSKLKKYREDVGLDQKTWHFLSGTAEDARRLSMLIGIKFSEDPESGEFMHDNKIVLISPEGEIKTTIQNLGDPETELVSRIDGVK